MKKLFIFTAILATLVLGLAACNDESTPVARDDGPPAADQNSGDDIPLGGPFVVPEGEKIPVEDEAEPEADKDKPENKNGSSKKKDPAASSDAQVKILKSSKTFGKVLLGEHYKVTVKAKGKDVAMSATGLPPGLTATSSEKDSKSLVIEGSPTEMGEYTVTIEAHNSTSKDEKKFTMKVVENLALNAYKLSLNDDGEWMWMRIEDAESVTIPTGEVIRLEARTVTGEDDAAEDDTIEGEAVKAESDKTEDGDSGDDADPTVDETAEADDQASGSDQDAHADLAEAGKAEVENDDTSAGKADKYFWSMNDVECTGDECEKDGLILTAANPFTGEKAANNSIRYLTVSSEFIGETIKSVTLKTWNVNGDEDHITLASLVFEKDPCDAPLALAVSDIKFNTKEFRKTTKFSAIVNVASGMAPFKWEIADSPTGSVNFASKSGTGTSNTMTVAGEFTPPKELTYKNLKEGWEFVSNIKVSDACTPLRSVGGTITVNLKDDDPPTPKVSEMSIQIDFGEINDTSSDGAYNEDTTYMYVYFLNESDQELGRVYYDLEPCGDGGSESNCEGVQPVDTNTKWTEDKKAVLTDIEKVKIKFHDDECFLCGDVDINIKKIEIYSNDWIAIYDDGNHGDRYDDDVVEDEWRTDDITDKMEGYVDNPLDIWSPKSSADENSDADEAAEVADAAADAATTTVNPASAIF